MCPGNHHDITQSQTISFHFPVFSFDNSIIPFKHILQFRLINPSSIVFDRNLYISSYPSASDINLYPIIGIFPCILQQIPNSSRQMICICPDQCILHLHTHLKLYLFLSCHRSLPIFSQLLYKSTDLQFFHFYM